MEAHGFALPGFEIIDTREPRWVGACVLTEFKFKTHFNGPMTARLFSDSPDCSHLLIRDGNGSPCLMGRLTVRRLSTNGLSIQARGDLLRAAGVWENVLGGQRLVRKEGVEKAIEDGYTEFGNDANLAMYVNLVVNGLVE